MILFALWFFAPAGLANSAPLIANKIPFLRDLNTPLDFGKTYRGIRIFGDNKRVRGLLFGMLVSTIALYLQQYLYKNSSWAVEISQGVDYSALPVLLLGPLFGFGALAGDAIESFVKRRIGVKPGDLWFPFDQIDYIIGGLLASMLVIVLDLQQYTVVFVVWFVMHIIFTYIGYLLGVRDKPI